MTVPSQWSREHTAEHDPQAFDQLFESEPSQPSASDVARWTQLYTELTELLQKQLDDTRPGVRPAAPATER